MLPITDPLFISTDCGSTFKLSACAQGIVVSEHCGFSYLMLLAVLIIHFVYVRARFGSAQPEGDIGPPGTISFSRELAS